MLRFFSDRPTTIEWQRPLISRVNPELIPLYGISSETDVYRIRHCYQTQGPEGRECPAYCESFFPVSLSLPRLAEEPEMTPPDFLGVLFPNGRQKLTCTEITLAEADQYLCIQLNCELSAPLFQVRQMITDRNKVVFINLAYLHPKRCGLNIGAFPELL